MALIKLDAEWSQLMEQYKLDHQNRINQACHTVGIPMIVFAVGVLGFEVVAEARGVPGWGTTGDILFVSAGGYHHHLGFNIWRGRGAPPVPAGTVGLRHWTIVIPAAGAAALRERVIAAGAPYEERPEGLLVRDPWNIPLLVVEASREP